MSTIISCKAIHKKYGDLEVLKGIDLEIEEGEVVAIVGPSGAGKTTLLQILGTLDSPSSREGTSLTIVDKDTQKLSEKEMALFRNKNLGFIFQFHELLPEFTALENVCMPGWIGNRKEEDLKKDATALLSQLGLADRTYHKPQEMSGGEQQRVAVARALINKPKIVFADEPSGNLDSENALYLHELFFNLRNQLGCTFVIVTHNEELAERVDRKILLKDGKIIS
jgi:lipoprotein-releasing system ATP-binding protein|tara:strand:- start:752 stop:1423 length:672 start_codon:yes stop_codon:yes gene_type:complete